MSKFDGHSTPGGGGDGFSVEDDGHFPAQPPPAPAPPAHAPPAIGFGVLPGDSCAPGAAEETAAGLLVTSLSPAFSRFSAGLLLTVPTIGFSLIKYVSGDG